MHLLVLGNPVPLGRPRFRVIRKGKAYFVMTYPAPSSKKWTDTIRTLAAVQLAGVKPLNGDLSITFTVTPGLTKAGKPKKRVGDLDNHIKGVLDALNGLAFVDDAQVREIHATMNPPSKNSGYDITITERP